MADPRDWRKSEKADELREFIDKAFKPKSAMKGLDRELIIDFVAKERSALMALVREELTALKFPPESFAKFDDKEHPQYPDYKDRAHERWHDQGYNNAIDSALVRLPKV